MSNLTSLKREIERMKELARERPASCCCRYLEIVRGAPLTDEQARILESNRACYERNHDHERGHIGWRYVKVPPAPAPRVSDNDAK
jgi:hypothetical protein